MAEVELDFLGETRRTHSCGDLRPSDVGKTAVLMGWVHRRRDLGGVIFIHLRDRDGITQLVFDESKNKEAHARAQELSSEYVIAVSGKVMLRRPETINSNIATGEVEVAARGQPEDSCMMMARMKRWSTFVATATFWIAL